MARYPGATWRPVHRYQPGVSGSIATLMRAHNRYILHTAVSSARSLFNWFNVSGRATSHFYIAADGYTEQYIDTLYRSTANLEGNPDCITVETQDMGSGFPSWSGSNVPAWTAAQVEALAKLGAWCNKIHGIPLTSLPSSRPGTRGVGWHRQGISPWRVSGGEVWSNANGKVCPGDRRVNQIPGIISRAKQIAGGTTPPPPQEDELNAEERAMLERIDRVLTRRSTTYVSNPDNDSSQSVRYGVERTWRQTYLARWAVKVLPNSWMKQRWSDIPDDGYSRDVYLRASYGHSRRAGEVGEANGREIAFLKAELAGMRSALQQLLEREGQQVDLGAVADASRVGAQQALAELDVRITVSPAGEPTGTDEGDEPDGDEPDEG